MNSFEIRINQKTISVLLVTRIEVGTGEERPIWKALECVVVYRNIAQHEKENMFLQLCFSLNPLMECMMDVLLLFVS